VPSVGVHLSRLDRFAATHHGLVTRDAALRVGISTSSWYRAIDSGLLEPLYPNIARLFGSPRSFHQRVLAAVWAVGSTAMASHRSAATLFGVERPDDDPIDVLVPDRTRRRVPSGITLHRPRVRHDLRPLTRFGIPTTNPMRMLIDLAAVDEDAVEEALVHVLSRKIVSPAALRSAIERHSIAGRHGIVRLREALSVVLADELPPDSELEIRFRSVVSRFGLPDVEFHPIILGYEVDFLVRGTTVIIECDGWGAHGLDRDQFEYDRERDAELVAGGYQVVHVTWKQVTQRPDRAASRIREVLQRWCPAVLG
jgi:very-short-patch-repair endonuclease